MNTKQFLTFMFACLFIQQVIAQDGIRTCGTPTSMDDILRENPNAAKDMQELENFTKEYVKNNNTNKFKRTASQNDPAYIIPIVFHILHTGGSENISYEQVVDAVRIINEDFQLLNTDVSEIKSDFAGIVGNPLIQFRLARLDPNGNCTNGVTRTYSELHKGAEDIDIKNLISWDTKKYLNVYCVSNIKSGAGAYAYLPGSWPAGSNRHGIVCRVSQLGSIGQSPGDNFSSRTLTHEIGHYLNLYHTWGPTNQPGLSDNCNFDDEVDDTPNTIGQLFGCNKDFESCGELSNTENYMDYSECFRMFTEGQCLRMSAALDASIGGRNTLWTESNLIATGTNDGYIAPDCTPVAEFHRTNRVICTNNNANVSFKDGSWRGVPTSWTWTFEGGNPSTSTEQNPSVSYPTAGTYKVKLKVSNATGTDSVEKEDYIRVLETVSTVSLPYQQGMEDVSSTEADIFNLDVPTVLNNKQWMRTTNAAFSGNASLLINYYDVFSTVSNAFILPSINLKGTSSPALRFKVAYARRSQASNNKLTINISRTCGSSYTGSIYDKSGADLATAPNFNGDFVPNGSSQWREETIPLSSALTSEDNAVFRFTATSDGPGNNIYIDDIEITATTGLEQAIYNNLNLQVAPNPFSSSTQLSFMLLSDATVRVRVLDVLGKEVGFISQQSLSSGQHTLEINDSNMKIMSSGLYFVMVSVNGMEKAVKVMVNK